MLVGSVLDAAVGEVLVELGLVDRVHRTDAHRHRGELPEIGHTSRMRVARHGERLAVDEGGVLLAEPVHLRLGEPSLEESPGVDAGGGVSLEVDLVSAALVVTAAEEVVEADLVQRGGRGVGGDVATDADAWPLCAVDHDGGVPAQELAVTALDLLVAGKPGLGLRGDGVDVVRPGQRGDAHLALAGSFQQLAHHVAGPRSATPVDHAVQRLKPLLGLLGVDVRDLTWYAVQDGSGFLAWRHVGVLSRSE